MQTTLKETVRLTGTGLHTGRPARLTLKPAPAGSGIVFYRTDISGEAARIPARWDLVTPSPLNSQLRNEAGTTLSTVEHLMAACAGTGLGNARVEIDGPEVPVLDGSSAPFARAILSAGLEVQDASLTAIEILRPVEARSGQASARLDPGAGLVVSFAIDFPDKAIGRQVKTLDMANGAFLRELCDARTFCRKADVDAMRAQGKALGGTLFNAVVVEGDKVLTPGGLRHPDEPVRHKMLDALGDLALAGAPILGRYTGVRAGHAMTNQLLRAIFAEPSAWRRVEVSEATARRLPGWNLRPSDLSRVA
ncbi:UDP-3-O-acyl-N-acetylglucosamine deacetylase [Pseudoroseicyclus tamaricis]|uniref:UDP-3-O-acyl-N-acetylglucosamine deacetylase n=1 Tax=Pseudoroseicyclus tamaricis TaxID=2705421 RepID=A0A6B2K4S1_9RHOB|nr:UDP-3-O-acyl-N-acetylglucosamine deacetylase [Pseudoroseicyclus tamaricis]NDV01706.1 UDP-3-O-acyl-N-acetylglucosamine deacetylase [Pseudoroseicyclus tamaricis]